ncbi:MAG: hypothetical protein JRC92_04300, partial [Deltaproteobacteria bacterium]|nr:hypothetical protein [Deltaproteobacteria bacterium]
SIVEAFTQGKQLIIIGEEFDSGFNTFLQPFVEHRHALNHIIRGKAAELGLDDPKRDTEYQRRHLEKALGHLHRAFFDAADWFSIIMRERIIDLLSPYSSGVIAETIPLYYSETRPKIDSISRSIAKVRDAKDVALYPSNQITTYVNALNELLDIYNHLEQAIPELAAKKEQKRFKFFRKNRINSEK